MRANQLRIGNFIKDTESGGVVRVICFCGDSIATVNEGSVNFATTQYDVDLNSCKGVELTEEWLVRFGFSIQKGDWSSATHTVNTDFAINNKIDGNWRFTPIWCKDYKPINYVHQLQNLYFALTGEELQLNEVDETKLLAKNFAIAEYHEALRLTEFYVPQHKQHEIAQKIALRSANFMRRMLNLSERFNRDELIKNIIEEINNIEE